MMIRAKNIMSEGVITITKDSTLQEAAKLMVSKKIGNLIVVDGKKLPIAVIGERDIVRGISLKKKEVGEVMHESFMIVSPETRFYEIADVLRIDHITRFTVVKHGKLIGIVTQTDIVESMRDFTKAHQLTQEAILAVFGVMTAFFLFYSSPLRSMLFG